MYCAVSNVHTNVDDSVYVLSLHVYEYMYECTRRVRDPPRLTSPAAQRRQSRRAIAHVVLSGSVGVGVGVGVSLPIVVLAEPLAHYSSATLWSPQTNTQ